MSNPFSLTNEFTIRWLRLPSNYRRIERFNGESSKEAHALKAIASVGLIGGQQLQQLFDIDKKRMNAMQKEHKLVRHEVQLKGKVIPIFTLGENGAIMAGMHDYYETNYWVKYGIEDVLKRLLFFALYKQFHDFSEDFEIQSAPNPFISAIKKENPFYVYIVRGETEDLLNFLKWNEYFNERLILVTESLRHLEPLKWVLVNKKVRVALDEDLLKENDHIQQLFFHLDNGEFVKENL